MGLTVPPGQGDDEIPSIPLSALEHVAYCRRQAALIHVEATWTESTDTVRGDLVHSAVDLPGTRRRHGLASIRALPVASRQYGLHGVCDLVEIRGTTAAPVEYKVGPYKLDGPADLQVAGQAVCLIEAGYDVPVGYVYSAASRRRHEVPITDELVGRMQSAAEDMRAILGEDRLPLAHNDRRCRRCSLRDDCLPDVTAAPLPTLNLFAPRPLGTWHD
ncbi:CRISPR-associated protein Cas4 [Thermoactinospora rubra]|uniref:CRISPR-associated protein Cas4 n=1 Tax=Thermoactinospora rubra TaxID=1088767 RepID=UPI001981B6A8|nr:CRISPR-associated protein Cas4 [Thermoactinospora rubra]